MATCSTISSTLVDQSLVQRDAPDAWGDGIRFRLLETIRAFALEQLTNDGRERELRRRHALAYLALAETAAAHLPGPDQPRWLDRLTVDYPNLRSSVRWSIDAGEVEIAQRFSAGMWRFWQQTGRLEDGTELTEAVLRMPGSDDADPSANGGRDSGRRHRVLARTPGGRDAPLRRAAATCP